MQRSDYRIGMVLLGRQTNPNIENHVRSGVRVISITENGLIVQRIHAFYLNNNPIESWTVRWSQLEEGCWTPLPIGYQLPLL